MEHASGAHSPHSATITALAIAVAARVPVLLWGSPGTGKTSAIQAMAADMGVPCETVIAAIREPSDFGGLPIVTDDAVVFAPPLWAKRLAKHGHGVLFLDEISTAPPAVQAALLRVVLERVVGDQQIPDDVVIVAAANPPNEAAEGWELSAPLANRFCHLDWHTDATTAAEGFAVGWHPPRVPALPVDWERQLHVVRSLVSTFFLLRPSLVTDVPSDPALAGRAWPSPRSWDMAARLWTAAEATGASSDVKLALASGAVGLGAATEFMTWLVEVDLPDPEEILRFPDTFELPQRGDRAHAVLAAVVSAVVRDLTVERWLCAWRVLGRVGTTAPDVGALAARRLAQCRPNGAPVPPEVRSFVPVLRAAGLLIE